MTPEAADDVIRRLTDTQVVALTLYGEARGERIEGRFAVASVIRNRVRHQRASWGLGYRGVCLKAWQFSCWLPQGGQTNYDLVLDAARVLARGEYGGPKVRECLWIAEGAISEQWQDTVRFATHYYNPAAMKPKGRVPEWAVGLEPVINVGQHLFYIAK